MRIFFFTIVLGIVFPLMGFSQNVSSAGSLTVGRAGHEIQKLSNGKTLVFGGGSLINNVFNIYASCELYTEATNVWGATSSMNVPRTDFASVVLSDGSVLAMGGLSPYTTSSCELYNPTTGQWTFTDSMQSPRSYFKAVLLSNGKVLAAGDGNGYELYDPSTQMWTSNGVMNYDHSSNQSTGDGFDMVALPNNKVYVISPLHSELYDVAGNTWSTNAPTVLPTTIDALYAILLNNNKVLITGDSSISPHIYSSVLYDIASNTLDVNSIRTITDVGFNIFYHTQLTKAANGNVFTFGYRGNMFSNDFIKMYNTATNQWYSIGTIPFTITGGNHYRSILLNNNKILVAGGELAALSTTQCYLVAANNVSVGVEDDADMGEITLYPNPSQGEINIKLTENNEPLMSYEIYNMLGQKVDEETIESSFNRDINLDIKIEGEYDLILKFANKSISKRFSICK